jgi:hypothetical protein
VRSHSKALSNLVATPKPHFRPQLYQNCIKTPLLNQPCTKTHRTVQWHFVDVSVHLLSAELLETRTGADREGKRTILNSNDPTFALYRVARRFGLPVVPEWASWFTRELERRKAIEPLQGLGCSPALVKGGKERFLGWIGKALKQGLISFPENNGAASWSFQDSSRPSSTVESKTQHAVTPHCQ